MTKPKNADEGFDSSVCSTACCGSKRDSKFCPDCGKRLRDDNEGLYGLLEHCQLTADQKAKCATKKRWHGETVEPHVEKRLEREHRAALKWQSWANALRELLKSQ
jgi:hypothetical protein